MTDIVQSGGTYRLTFLALDSSHNAVTGATVTAKIRRHSDGAYWNGTAFQVTATTVSLSEISAANLPGLYVYSFSTPSALGSDVVTTYVSSSTAGVVNDPEIRDLTIGGYINNLDSDLAAIAIGSAQISGISDLLSLIRSQIIILSQTTDGTNLTAQTILDRLNAAKRGARL